MLGTFNFRSFRSVDAQVLRYALSLIANDWKAYKQAVSTGITIIITKEAYNCELLLRYSLPCKHHLLYTA
jgi:hypothetical protein